MKGFVTTYGKALTASAGALVAGVGAAMIDGNLTQSETVTAIGAALVFGFAAWAAPYRPTSE